MTDKTPPDPDLTSRTFGFAGVFVSLIGFGLLNSYDFITVPQHDYPPVLLEIRNEILSPAPQEVEVPRPQPAQPAPRTETQVQKPAPQPRQQVPQKPAERAEQKPRVTVDKRAGIDRKTETKNQPESRPAQPAATDTVSRPQQTRSAASETAQKEAARRTQEQQTQVRRFVSNMILNQIKSSLVYPQNAVRRKIQGVVTLEFTIKGGIIKSFRVAKSSGHKILDSAAEKLAQKLVGFNTRQDNDLVLNVPIQYALVR